MAWLDDRVWCHPKFTGLSGNAGWAWTKGCAYSTGFGTKGHLSREQQRLVGGVGAVRRELVAAGLWEERPDGAVYVHDWDDHNSKRDARRVAERERMRAKRAQERTANSSQKNGRTDAGTFEEPSRVDGSEGSDLRPKGFTATSTDKPSIHHIIDQSLKGVA